METLLKRVAILDGIIIAHKHAILCTYHIGIRIMARMYGQIRASWSKTDQQTRKAQADPQITDNQFKKT